MDENIESQKPSKRFRNPNSHKRMVNKLKREKGEEYENYKGKAVPAKVFQAVVCKCRKSCHIAIPETEQRKIFNEFWNLNTWSQKTTFLLNNVSSNECKKRRKPQNRKNIQFKKSFRREYFFGNAKNTVCKAFFISVLQISGTRIDKCIKKNRIIQVSVRQIFVENINRIHEHRLAKL